MAGIIDKLKCRISGHKRGKRIGQATSSNGKTFNDFQCPRCTATWTRKVKAA